jgi:hypothetical protein
MERRAAQEKKSSVAKVAVELSPAELRLPRDQKLAIIKSRKRAALANVAARNKGGSGMFSSLRKLLKR